MEKLRGIRDESNVVPFSPANRRHRKLERFTVQARNNHCFVSILGSYTYSDGPYKAPTDSVVQEASSKKGVRSIQIPRSTNQIRFGIFAIILSD